MAKGRCGSRRINTGSSSRGSCSKRARPQRQPGTIQPHATTERRPLEAAFRIWPGQGSGRPDGSSGSGALAVRRCGEQPGGHSRPSVARRRAPQTTRDIGTSLSIRFSLRRSATAVKYGGVDRVRALLRENPECMRVRDKDGRTPLHYPYRDTQHGAKSSSFSSPTRATHRQGQRRPHSRRPDAAKRAAGIWQRFCAGTVATQHERRS